jgi:hypothetical protein
VACAAAGGADTAPIDAAASATANCFQDMFPPHRSRLA